MSPCGIQAAHPTARAKQNQFVKSILKNSSLPKQRCLCSASPEGTWGSSAIQTSICFKCTPFVSREQCQQGSQRLWQGGSGPSAAQRGSGMPRGRASQTNMPRDVRETPGVSQLLKQSPTAITSGGLTPPGTQTEVVLWQNQV